ncbi:hypothetical protein T492DRAFT_288465 [Pavlovales sp. CCMP2436]|nr:hypothetical protein T492DRAFT_288465 [Pavlovales sp. CCMP2436]
MAGLPRTLGLRRQLPRLLPRLAARQLSSSFGPNPTPANLGVHVVPQQSAYVVERFGRFSKVMNAGIHFLVPLVDRVAYVHVLKEETISVPSQTAITKDNVSITIDGILYVRVIDPVKASYGIEDPHFAVTQLAQTTMRSELGKISLDRTFQERDQLNALIVASINAASEPWGIQCMRYEIRDIVPPKAVRAAMELEAEAERRKRASILDSEGDRQAAVNAAGVCFVRCAILCVRACARVCVCVYTYVCVCVFFYNDELFIII